MKCVFCDIITKKTPAHIVYEDGEVIVFLDKYPQTRGHLQMVPKTHCRWVYDLPDMGKFFTTAANIIRVIIPILEADHVTLAAFGHEIQHAHLWIVPQYRRKSKISEFRRNKGSLEEVSQLLHTVLSVQRFKSSTD